MLGSRWDLSSPTRKDVFQTSLISFKDQIRSVAQSCPTLCNPMNRSTPDLPVHHQLPAQRPENIISTDRYLETVTVLVLGEGEVHQALLSAQRWMGPGQAMRGQGGGFTQSRPIISHNWKSELRERMGFDPGCTGNPNPTPGIFTSLRLNGRHLHHPDPVHLLPITHVTLQPF